MRTLLRKNIKSHRVELDKQICSPDKNAIPMPDEELNKFEDHIIDTLLNDILKERESEYEISQVLAKKQNFLFSFAYSPEQIENDEWLIRENKLKQGKRILTSVLVDIEMPENIFSLVEILENDLFERKNKIIASYYIIFNLDTLFETKMEYCRTHDVGDIEWYNEDGEEYDAEHPYIRDQLYDIVDSLDSSDTTFFEESLNIDHTQTLYCDCCDTKYYLDDLPRKYLHNENHDAIDLIYIRER
jgi:hypothetical protein